MTNGHNISNDSIYRSTTYLFFSKTTLSKPLVDTVQFPGTFIKQINLLSFSRAKACEIASLFAS